jgi:membrane protease YdiL (CAAX protease family)
MRAQIWLAVTLAFATLNFIAISQAPERGEDTVYSYDVLVSAAVGYGVLLVVVLLLTAGLPRRELMALRAPSSWGSAIGLSVAGLLVILVGAAILLYLSGAGDEQNLAPEEWDGSRAGAYAASFLAIVFIGPVVEELLYRGVGIGLFAQRGQVTAIGVTAVMFGLGHGLLLSLAAFVWFGIVTGWIRFRTDSLYPPIFVHCAFNAFGMILPVVV